MNQRHGLSRYPLYGVWSGMRARCYNENNPRYKHYGGRGITICDEWCDSPILFVDWALNNGYKKGLSVDRENNNGNYNPDNCRFITQKQSSYNKRLLPSHNTTGYRGVSKSRNSYRSTIKVDRNSYHLGVFTSPVLAALRYDVEAYLLNDGRPRNFF